MAVATNFTHIEYAWNTHRTRRATIAINGYPIGQATDQFLRYSFSLRKVASRLIDGEILTHVPSTSSLTRFPLAALSLARKGKRAHLVRVLTHATCTLTRLYPGKNQLSVTFDSSIHTDGRFMACSGGWDWAPFTDTYSQMARTFSR